MAIVVAVLLTLCTVEADSVATTVYVGKHFEVREGDQAVKYVFNGETRVARITGSLSSGTRVQRVRLFAGWNLVSVAVTVTDLAGQLEQSPGGPVPLVTALYRWNPVTVGYEAVTGGQNVSAGSVIWVRAATNQVVGIRGEYGEPAGAMVGAGGGYVSGPGLERWPLGVPAGVTIWRFDAASGRWQSGFTGELASVSDLPPTLAAGEAIYVHTGEPVELTTPAPAQRLAYYHPDHLGSATAVTDAGGRLVAENAYHPFGSKRYEFRPQAAETDYEFAEKERDSETGLMEFGRRYYLPVIGRWMSADPLAEKGGSLNLYAYARQNPLTYRDPDGAEITITTSVDPKTRETTHEIKLTAVVLDVSGNPRITKEVLEEYSQKLKSTIESAYSGHDGQAKVRWKTSVDVHVISDRSQRKANEHVFLITGSYRMKGAGETRHGGMIMKVQAHTLLEQPPSKGVEHYDVLKQSYKSPESVGAHEFGHAAGLDDFEEDTSNLMSHGRQNDQKIITLDQVNKIIESPHNLPED
jgi:RHS repeat-associated protein